MSILGTATNLAWQGVKVFSPVGNLACGAEAAADLATGHWGKAFLNAACAVLPGGGGLALAAKGVSVASDVLF